MNLEDRAQEHEAIEWSMRNAARPARATFQPGEAGYGPAECECGAIMPELRRIDGRRLCTGCQAKVERAARR